MKSLKRVLSYLLALTMLFAVAISANAIDTKPQGLPSEYWQAADADRIQSQKDIELRKYYLESNIDLSKYNVKVLHDEPVTLEVLRKSENEAVLVRLEELTPKMVALAGNTDTNSRTGTYLCDGNYFYVSSELTANLKYRSDDSNPYYQLSYYYHDWSTSNTPDSDYNDPNGYCIGTSDSSTIKQLGLKYSTGLQGAAADINFTCGPFPANVRSHYDSHSWNNREAYRVAGTGALIAYTTFNIKTCRKVENGVHYDVKYFYVDRFLVGWNDVPV